MAEYVSQRPITFVNDTPPLPKKRLIAALKRYEGRNRTLLAYQAHLLDNPGWHPQEDDLRKLERFL
mgnify:CR=1 FL=1